MPEFLIEVLMLVTNHSGRKKRNGDKTEQLT